MNAHDAGVIEGLRLALEHIKNGGFKHASMYLEDYMILAHHMIGTEPPSDLRSYGVGGVELAWDNEADDAVDHPGA